MDKKSVIGLTLIGAILIAFSFFNKPSKEELRAKKEQELKKIEATASESLKDSLVKALDSTVVLTEDSLKNTLAQSAKDSTNKVVAQKPQSGFQAFATNAAGTITTLENDLIKVNLNSKGGKVSSVFLKKYEAYDNFLDEKNHKDLQLFDDNGSQASLTFKYKGKTIETGNLNFKLQEASKNKVVYRLEPESGKYIDYIYAIADSSYDLQFNIAFHGFSGKINPKDVFLDLGLSLLQTEKDARLERMVSTVFFETKEGYDYLSERSDDKVKPEFPMQWVAFKQSYFSAVLIPESDFHAIGSSFEIKTYKEGDKDFNKYVKDYKAKLNLGLNSTADGTVKMSWYFGPNDYQVLASYNKNLEDIINYGWGLFRWVNIYMIQPIYEFLIKIGMGAGIAILVLTILVKLILTPVTWKMYVSSAKMRILKPEIEELNKKYPDKSDAMKKQMETMSLYKESGASPLSGCLPMLIQMPILFAAYRFFPSTFSIRQEGFLWANDLSTFDVIASWDQHIPVLSSIYGNHVSLFTLLMAVTTLIYTHVNSGNMQQPTQTPGMPNMKVIMYIFPVMMIFFFNNYSAGLSYYYFISTLMSIVIMYSIKFFFVDEKKLKAKMEERKLKMQKTNGNKKKSKFQERLEMMQKQQQERLKRK